MTVILEVDGLSKQFGGLAAVSDVSFSLNKGQVAALIGPNGAGKSTTFSLVAGTLQPSAGEVRFKGQAITGQQPHQIVRSGLARTFQSTVIWGRSTVWENICRGGLVRNIHSRGMRNWIGKNPGIDQVNNKNFSAILELLSLSGHKDQIAGTLPYGHQRRLGIAIALASEPELLLLDEPAAGLNDEETSDLAKDIREIVGHRGVTVLLVEHHMKMVMGLCAQIFVIDRGKLISKGTPQEVSTDPAVIEAYLGKSELDHGNA